MEIIPVWEDGAVQQNSAVENVPVWEDGAVQQSSVVENVPVWEADAGWEGDAGCEGGTIVENDVAQESIPVVKSNTADLTRSCLDNVHPASQLSTKMGEKQQPPTNLPVSLNKQTLHLCATMRRQNYILADNS